MFSDEVMEKLHKVLTGYSGEYVDHVLQAAEKKAAEVAEMPRHSVVVIRRMHYVFFFLVEADRSFSDVEIHRELSEPGHDFVWAEIEES